MERDEPASQHNRSFPTRRDLLAGVGGIAALLALGGAGVASGSPLVRPPGGQSAEGVLSKCIRCQKCYEVCPRGVIAPAHLEDGIVALRTPVMDFSNDYCDFCTEENGGVPLCAQSCPTGALTKCTRADSMSIVLGKASVDTDSCLAYRATGCRFCHDACPYDAIEVDEMGRVSVVAERCNGCGACESVCVSLKDGSVSNGTTLRAITVKPIV